MAQVAVFERAKRASTRLLSRHGKEADIVRIEVTGGGPSDPDGGEETEILHPVAFIETGYQVGLHDGTLIQAGDKLGVINVPPDVTPVPFDILRLAGKDYTLIDVKPVEPGDVLFQYAVQGRS